MPRPSQGRAEAAPLTVRLSHAERLALEQKASVAGMRVSDAARAAFEAWTPAGTQELQQQDGHRDA